VDLRRQEIKKILLVRSIFRMGDSILATPAILLLRNNFPAAQIDFVGPRVSAILFRHLPIDNHHEVYQSFPRVCWSYVSLLKQIRSARYDLAIDVSGSNAALGAFIVGFSGARFRAGLRGKYDRWFNLRFCRPAQKNKYRNLPELFGSMGLETRKVLPTLVLSAEEKEYGTRRIDAVATAASFGCWNIRRRQTDSRQTLAGRKFLGAGGTPPGGGRQGSSICRAGGG
jgi:heptosyltransferase-3